MKLISTLLALSIGFTGLNAYAGAADGVAATVNGKPIKQSLVDFIVKDAQQNGQKVDDNMKFVIINKLIGSELVAQEAAKTGFDKSADYQTKQELANRELLVNSYVSDWVKKNPVSDADVKAGYEELKKELGDKEYKASHILVPTEAEAKEIIAQLGKGGNFAKLAKEKSKDPGSKDKGGDLGWFSPATMVKPFSDAVMSLKKGEVSQTPVQTQFGWHVIKMEDSRATQVPPFDKVKDGIKRSLQQRKLEQMMNDLRAKATVVDNVSKK